MKISHFFLLLPIFLIITSCRLEDKMNKYQAERKYSKKIDSYLSKTKSSLKFDGVYSDKGATKKNIIVSYDFYDSYNEYSKDIIALQEFLSLRNIQYGYIVAIDERGSQMFFDQTTYNNHKKCLKTVLNFSNSLMNANQKEILKFLDEKTLNEKSVVELFQYLGAIKSVEIIHYQPVFNEIIGSHSEMFTVCLNHDQVISMSLNYDNTQSINSCNLVGNNCNVPQPRRSSASNITEVVN